MLAYFRRRRTGKRWVLIVLAFAALALKIVSPPGFMVGTGLAEPIVLCAGQGSVMSMSTDTPMAGHGEHGGHQQPPHAPQQNGEHPCPFATFGAAALIPDFGVTVIVAISAVAFVAVARAPAAAPGRGMTAPPPPSRAPPVFHV